ncbi:MAG: HAD family hydrolase [bacterium]|nr:HAD family hydrolase [bacterium]
MSEQTIKADSIIFDVDGTIWDSRDTVAEAWNAVMERYYPQKGVFPKEFLTGLFGKTMEDIAAALFPELHGEERAQMAERCFQYENELLEEKPGKVYDGVKETMALLSERFPLFIVSNCQCGYIEACMKGAGIASYITDHLCYGDTLAPKSETLRRIAAKHGLRQPVYVGDTQGDADACKEADIPMIFVTYGLGKVEKPRLSAASIRELPKIIEHCSK